MAGMPNRLPSDSIGALLPHSLSLRPPNSKVETSPWRRRVSCGSSSARVAWNQLLNSLQPLQGPYPDTEAAFQAAFLGFRCMGRMPTWGPIERRSAFERATHACFLSDDIRRTGVPFGAGGLAAFTETTHGRIPGQTLGRREPVCPRVPTPRRRTLGQPRLHTRRRPTRTTAGQT